MFIFYVIFSLKGYVIMDKEWLKYWQKVENLEHGEEDDEELMNASEKEKEQNLEEAKDLYKIVLDDDN